MGESAAPTRQSRGFPRRTDCYIIGLTGNIATGKSTIDAMLAAKGAIVIDGDALVHQLQLKGQPVLERMVQHFGPEILTADGELDRAKLGGIVFNDAAALRELELIVHPAVGQETQRLMDEAPAGSVLVYDAIKLIEGRVADACDSVWVVTAPANLQEERLIRQRGLTPEAARGRINAQNAQEEKVQRADVVIDNSGSLEDTQRAVDEAWERTAAVWKAGLPTNRP